MKYKFYIILLLALVLSISFIACGYNGPVVTVPSRPPAQTEKQTADANDSSQIKEYPITAEKDSDEWNTIIYFSGVDDKISPDFDISGKEWRLTWTIETEMSEQCTFSIFVYNREKSAIPVKVISLLDDEVTDTVNFNGSEGSYYLKIIAANLQNWAITVEDHSYENTESPVQIVEIHYKGTLFAPDPDECLCYERIEPDEYVVVKNFSMEWADVRDWKIVNVSREGNFRFVFPDYFNCCPDYFTDYLGSDYKCVPPMPCILAPLQSVLIYTDEFHPESGGLSFNYGSGGIWENDKPNVAVLYDAEGKEISRKSYSIPSKQSLTPSVQITYINYRDRINFPYIDNISAPEVKMDEYVEITNLSDQYQAMGGWILLNKNKDTPVFIFPSNFALGPSDRILIYTDEVHIPGNFSFYYSPGDFWDNKEPDTAVLYNTMGEEISRSSYKIMD